MSIIENTIYHQDSIAGLAQIDDSSIDLILSDIPYGIGAADWDVLHANTNSGFLGSSPAQARAGDVFKRRGKPINGWSQADKAMPREYYEWCRSWAPEWNRVLKPGGSAIIFAGRRFAHRCIVAMEDSGFVLRDMLAWERPTAVHRAQRLSVVFDRRGDTESAEKWDGWRLGNLRPTFEPVIWCMKPYKQGKTIADNVLAYGLGAYNEAAFIRAEGEPENIIRSGFGPNERGHHPTQKPLALMKSLIELVTTEDHVVLDPFCGSGTTLVAAKLLGRKYVGFEIDDAHYQAAVGRLDELKGGLF